MFKWMIAHKKATAILGVVVLFIILLIVANVYDSNKTKAEQEILELEAEEELSEFDKDQMRYVERWGEPTEGFRWDDNGSLVALGEVGRTPQEVAYIYMRSLSTLDFANAERYSYKTTVIDEYSKFYQTDNEFSYNRNFESNIYKEVLLSIEPLDISSTATFASFKEVLTMQVNMIDLSDKDFWLDDWKELFKELRKYRVEERDTTKMRQFIYDYVLAYYTSSDRKMKTYDVDLVMEQTRDGAWLVSNDSDLDAIAQYQDGELVVNTILNNYEDWASSLDEEDIAELDRTDNSTNLLDRDDGEFRPDTESEGREETTSNIEQNVIDDLADQ